MNAARKLPWVDTKPAPRDDFRSRISIGVAVAAAVLVVPFALNNLVQGQILLGSGGLAIAALLGFVGWSAWQGVFENSRLILIPPILVFLVYAINEQQIIGVLWCYPAIMAMYFVFPERTAWVANLVALLLIVPTSWSVVDRAVWLRVVATMVIISVFSMLTVRVIESQRRKLEALAVTDPLTGALNRALLGQTLEQAIRQSERANTPMTVIAIDLDHFKSINDTLGHAVGDKVLRSVADFLRSSVRSADVLFRLGGEEFALLAYATNLEGGRVLAEELCSELPERIRIDGRVVTASFGVAALRPGDGPDSWIVRADDNMYLAKQSGRACVVTDQRDTEPIIEADPIQASEA